MPADAGAAHGDDADLLVVSVAELLPQRLAVGDLGGFEAGHVPGEAVMLARPVTDQRELRPEGVGDDVVGVADASRSPPSGMGSHPTKSVSHT
jgi:hypothetical protein